MAQAPFNRLLLTGAAGGLGRVLRKRLKPFARVLRASDIADLGAAGAGEEVVHCDLALREPAYDFPRRPRRLPSLKPGLSTEGDKHEKT